MNDEQTSEAARLLGKRDILLALRDRILRDGVATTTQLRLKRSLSHINARLKELGVEVRI